jgi:hypothetical protein
MLLISLVNQNNNNVDILCKDAYTIVHPGRKKTPYSLELQYTKPNGTGDYVFFKYISAVRQVESKNEDKE